ncbi:MAG: hypothetical protein HN366_00365 [Deltaproteobacteria bacterium]|jgi:hypothetical protein|nr:hypothetical protein [Deltaproteobacteria bacterium]
MVKASGIQADVIGNDPDPIKPMLMQNNEKGLELMSDLLESTVAYFEKKGMLIKRKIAEKEASEVLPEVICQTFALN